MVRKKAKCMTVVKTNYIQQSEHARNIGKCNNSNQTPVENNEEEHTSAFGAINEVSYNSSPL